MRSALSVLVFLLPARAWAGGSCRPCHASQAPTKERPALAACPRERLVGPRSAEGVPETLTLGEGAEGYGPVRFPHRAHAEASGPSGCVQCHHYDQARAVSSCGDCHEASKAREELAKPAKGPAIHRQCLDCHRRWNPDGRCASCHESAGGTPARSTSWVHIRSHAALACGRCHAPGVAGFDDCEDCHAGWRRGFEHARTGVALRGAHKDLECSSCHGEGRFSAKPSCAGCHPGRSFPKERP